MGKYVLNKETGTFVPAPSEESVQAPVVSEKKAEGPVNGVDIMEKDDQVKLASSNPGLPDEPTETFKRLSDLSVFQIVDKPTGKIMGVISGYALQIKFNREAITSAADVEECAEGLKKLFYNIIMDQLIGND